MKPSVLYLGGKTTLGPVIASLLPVRTGQPSLFDAEATA